MASTFGSAAACARNACTDVENESYGWCSRMSRSRIAAKMSCARLDSTSAICRFVVGTKGGNFRSGRSMPPSSKSTVASSGAGRRYTSSGVTPIWSASSWERNGEVSSEISRRIGGPKRRRSSSFSIALSRFSASSSSTSMSSFRVTRNERASLMIMPGNSVSKCAMIRFSIVMKP